VGVLTSCLAIARDVTWSAVFSGVNSRTLVLFINHLGNFVVPYPESSLIVYFPSTYIYFPVSVYVGS
jgi:hypothetical protein